jgi:hypothetical protein
MTGSKTKNKSGGEKQAHPLVDAEPGSSTQQPDKASSKKPPRPSQCRNYTRKAVAESFPDIIETFVDEAKGGSVSHFNQLAKFGGFDLRPIPAPGKRKGKSFAQRLLDDMKEHEAKMIAANEARLAAERESGQ